MGPESLSCSEWRKISKSRCDLDLDRTMPNIELSKLFSYTTMYLNFVFLDQFLFAIVQNTHTQKHTHTPTPTPTDEYSIVIIIYRYNNGIRLALIYGNYNGIIVSTPSVQFSVSLFHEVYLTLFYRVVKIDTESTATSI